MTLRSVYSSALLASLAGLVFLVTACEGPSSESSRPVRVPRAVEIEFVGTYDGEELRLVPVRSALWDERGALDDISGPVGVAAEPLLQTLDAGTFGTGMSGTGEDFVALEQISRAAVTNDVTSGAAWDTTRCGPVPQDGVCVQIRMRNLFDQYALARAHFELTELTPIAPTTAVSVPLPASDNDTAPPDTEFGVNGVGRGLWRYGGVRRSSPTGEGPVAFWAFIGATPNGSNFRFTFRGVVRGDLVAPIVRADVIGSDLPPTYGTGTPGNGAAADGVDISADGRYVVFVSSATNLVPGTTAAIDRVFRADLVGGSVELVSTGSSLSVPATCASRDPSISDDGAVVAFASDCALEPADTNSVADVYVRRLAPDVGTILVSRNQQGQVRSQPSSNPYLSSDGRWVAFESRSGLVAYHPSGRTTSDIYRRLVDSLSAADADIRAMTRYYASGSYRWFNGDSRNPEVASVGSQTVVVFETDATDATTETDANGVADVVAVVWAATGSQPASRTRMSVSTSGGELDGASGDPTISADGFRIAFASEATNALGESTSGRHVYLRNRTSASSLQLVDRRPDGTVSAGDASDPDLGGNQQRYLVYRSTATDLTNTAPGGPQVYAFDRLATDRAFARSFAVSLTDSFAYGAGSVGAPAVAADGSYVAFVSSFDLVGGGSVAHVFRAPVVDPRDQ